MPKIIRTTDKDYRIITARGGTITLDTLDGQQPSLINVDNLIIGYEYVIVEPGNTDFTLIGAADSNQNTIFFATDVGTGTGIVRERFPVGNGNVVVKGNLEVQGTTSTIDSTRVTIADNIIVLSSGNDQNGLPSTLDIPYSSGIEIERGQFPNARWIYNDSISWSLGSDNGIGTWEATQGSSSPYTRLPLATPGIVAGGDFYINLGDGVISVTGSNDYERKVWLYDDFGNITADPITGSVIVDDDHIPNVRAIVDYFQYSVGEVQVDKIQQDNSSVRVEDLNNVITSVAETGTTTTITTFAVHGYQIGDTLTIEDVRSSPLDLDLEGINGTWTIIDIPSERTIEFNYNSTNADLNNYVTSSGRTIGPETKISINLEGQNVANFYNQRANIGDIEIRGNTIETFNSDLDLILSAPGAGNVIIKDILEITKTPGDDDAVIDPVSPGDGIRIYSKNEGQAGTGLYFTNDNGTNDELISKNRALLYGMLF